MLDILSIGFATVTSITASSRAVLSNFVHSFRDVQRQRIFFLGEYLGTFIRAFLAVCVCQLLTDFPILKIIAGGLLVFFAFIHFHAVTPKGAHEKRYTRMGAISRITFYEVMLNVDNIIATAAGVEVEVLMWAMVWYVCAYGIIMGIPQFKEILYRAFDRAWEYIRSNQKKKIKSEFLLASMHKITLVRPEISTMIGHLFENKNVFVMFIWSCILIGIAGYVLAELNPGSTEVEKIATGVFAIVFFSPHLLVKLHHYEDSENEQVRVVRVVNS